MRSFFYTLPDNTSDATFRAWGSAISAALAAVGMIKVTGVGEIDWNTVARPATTSTDAGFEVWRFPDSLHSTDPFYLRLDYGTGISTVANLRIRSQVGQGVSGAGALTGNVTNSLTDQIVPQTTGSPAMCFASYNDGGLTIALWINASSAGSTWLLSVSRFRNALGVAQAGGVNVCTLGQSRRQQILPSVGATFPTTALGDFACVHPSGSQSGNFAGALGVFPVQPFRGYLDYPDLGFVLYQNTDISLGQLVPVLLAGGEHEYCACGVTGTDTANDVMTGAALLVRCE